MERVPYPSLDTPAVLVDLVKLEANIKEMSQQAAEAGVKLKPHTKVHGSAEIARMQIEAGACGIEVGPVAQAEAMAEAGIDDILTAHPFYGDHKLEILKKLLLRPWLKITVTVDMIEQAEGISRVGQAVGRKVPAYMKIDTSVEETDLRRFGTFPGEPTLNLAKKIDKLPGIELVGIYAHEMGTDFTPEGRDKTAYNVADIMAKTARMLRGEGIAIEDVAVGSSPTFRSTCRYKKEGKFPEINEIHPGGCVIGDIVYMVMGANTIETCAATVLTTVVSTSREELAVLDTGFKTLSNDPLTGTEDMPGFSWRGMRRRSPIKGRPDLFLGFLGAESGFLYYMDPKKKLNLGERLEIIPNNATVIMNIHGEVYGVRNGLVERVIRVTGRGRGN